ncbi:MAG: cold shock domain-containing protein [Yoonia sp.]|nr:cold shock domain-containing protein [Yoonia sp.]
MTDDIESDTAQVMTGVVKWFDPSKGFGFVVCDTGGPDVLLHANVLRNFGQGSVVDGSVISMTVQQSDRGIQAVKILTLTPPKGDQSTPPLRDMEEFTADEIAAQPVLPARVKWFDKGKGFGFANVFGDAADVFVHVEVLRRCGLSDLQAGEGIGLRLIEGSRGRMAVDVVSWETVAK